MADLTVDQLNQLVLSGATVGCVSALVALGFVIVANVTGVYNFAQGEYVAAGGFIAVWGADHGLGWPLICGLAAMGVAVLAGVHERLTVAPTRGRAVGLGVVVASLGVAVGLRGLALMLFGPDPQAADPFVPGVFSIGGARLSNQALFVWGLTAISLVATLVLFTRTAIGRAMRAVAINPSGARMLGIRVEPLSVLAFVLSGALMGLVGAVSVPITLVAWNSGIVIGLNGFVAAAVADFSRPGRAVAAGLGLSIIESIAAGYVSSSYRLLFVFGVLLVYLVGRDLTTADGFVTRCRQRVGGSDRDAPTPRSPTAGAWLRRALGRTSRRPSTRWRRAGVPVAVIVIGVLPMTAESPRLMPAATVAVLLAIGATGLGLVMGLAGQLSLGHGALFLLGGYTAAILAADHGWPMLPALLAGIGVASFGGAVIGWITLRLDAFNLAIATLAVHLSLVVVATQAVGFTGGVLGKFGVPPPRLWALDLSSPKRFYAFCLLVLAGCVFVASSLWRSRFGLLLRAVGVDQDGAASAGLDPFALKLRVFVVSSAMAGLGGALWAFHLRFAEPTSWGIPLTIDLVAFVVVGGLTSPNGGVVGVAVLEGVRYLVGSGTTGATAQNLDLVVSGLLLIVFALAFRGGITATLGQAIQRLGIGRDARLAASGVDAIVTPSTISAWAPVGRSGRVAEPDVVRNNVLSMAGVDKRFGAVAAVSGVDLELRAGQVTAVIGPNGAGKSTVINMLSGELVPTSGTVELDGCSITARLPNEIRARGVARTFQTPRTFPGLSAIETVLLSVPLSIADPSRHARECLGFVGLMDDGETQASALPAGSQRLLEIARALASSPRVILMDEPAAGLDDTETTQLGSLIRRVADAGVAVLLVEHAVGLVLAVADSLVVLDQGIKIADGPPEDVVRDAAVIEAYLGGAPV